MREMLTRLANWIDNGVMHRLVILLQEDEGEPFRDIYRRGYDSVVNTYLDRARKKT